MTPEQFRRRADKICRMVGIPNINIWLEPHLNAPPGPVATYEIKVWIKEKSRTAEITQCDFTAKESILNTVPAFRDYLLVHVIARYKIVRSDPLKFLKKEEELHKLPEEHPGSLSHYNSDRRWKLAETALMKRLSYSIRRYKGLIVQIYRSDKLVWAANSKKFRGNELISVGPRSEDGSKALWPAFD